MIKLARRSSDEYVQGRLFVLAATEARTRLTAVRTKHTQMDQQSRFLERCNYSCCDKVLEQKPSKQAELPLVLNKQMKNLPPHDTSWRTDMFDGANIPHGFKQARDGTWRPVAFVFSPS